MKAVCFLLHFLRFASLFGGAFLHHGWMKSVWHLIRIEEYNIVCRRLYLNDTHNRRSVPYPDDVVECERVGETSKIRRQQTAIICILYSKCVMYGYTYVCMCACYNKWQFAHSTHTHYMNAILSENCL